MEGGGQYQPGRTAQPASGDDRLGDAVKRAADEYNQIADQSAKAGMQQFLNDENFEMSKVEGRLTYEVLALLFD